MTSPGRYIVRPHLHLGPHEPLECPRGHRVRSNALLVSHDVFICQAKDGGQLVSGGTRGTPGGECGMRVFVIRWPDGRKYLAEVTPVEAIYMRDQNMSPDEALSFLSSAPPREKIA